MTTPDHTLRPVIDELRAAQTPPGDHIHFPEVEWPEPGPDGGLVGVERGCATVAAPQPDAYDPAVDAAARGLLSASCLSGAQLKALQARRASECQPITDRAAWSDPVTPTWSPTGIPDLPIGMIEPPTDPALAALAEVEAAARALVAMVPRRPTLLQRLLPTTATAFWIAVSVWLGFLLARADGWL